MRYHELTVEETAKKLNTDINSGLSDKEAKKRLNKYGKNRIIEKKKKSVFARFFEQFNDFMIIILRRCRYNRSRYYPRYSRS